MQRRKSKSLQDMHALVLQEEHPKYSHEEGNGCNWILSNCLPERLDYSRAQLSLSLHKEKDKEKEKKT